MANGKKTTGRRKKSTPSKRKKIGGFYVYALYGVCLIAGLIIGAIVYKQLTKNDGFALIGDQTVTLHVGDSAAYTDPGAALVRYGRDRSDRIEVKTNLKKADGEYRIDTSAPGSYYISYTADVRGYSGVKLIRTIRVVEDEGR